MANTDVRIYAMDGTHRKLKILAAGQGKTMAQFLEELVNEKLWAMGINPASVLPTDTADTTKVTENINTNS